jgi:hypothetical protein
MRNKIINFVGYTFHSEKAKKEKDFNRGRGNL